MIFSRILPLSVAVATDVACPSEIVSIEENVHAQSPQHKKSRSKGRRLPGMMCLCLILAYLGAAWFAYHAFLIPQSQSFTPNWHDAQWIQENNANTPVAYFRYTTALDVIPDAASITIVASQVFRLYVNGSFVGSNAANFIQGDALRPSLYDVSSLLGQGSNVIGIRVANLDQQKPAVRASLDMVIGKSHLYFVTNNTWQATSQSSAVFPRDVKISSDWTTAHFDANGWGNAGSMTSAPISSQILVSPLLYEQPLPASWMTAGNGHYTYFVRQLTLSSALPAVWLRVAATNPVSVMINGNLFFTWNGQPPVPLVKVPGYLGYLEPKVIRPSGYAEGVYNIAPYLHGGVNIIAIQVAVPGSGTLGQNQTSVSAALAVDLLTVDARGNAKWYTEAQDWHASAQTVNGWEQGNAESLTWSSPVLVEVNKRPYHFYIPDSAMLAQNNNSVSTTVFMPVSLIFQVILGSTLVVLVPWLLLSVMLGRSVFGSIQTALETLSLAYLPALAVESVLLVLSLEPLMPQPFPYTTLWGTILIALVLGGYALLLLNTAWLRKKHPVQQGMDLTAEGHGSEVVCETVSSHQRWRSIVHWLRLHWPLPVLVLIAIPLIFYNLPYEPYWQDELVSFYVAKSILTHGYPAMPSGFIYPKGELYSYVLAVVMFFFGDQGAVPRMVSAVEFIVSIPLFYFVVCYFFNRRVAALAVAMLVFSPYAFSWARQVRMYEQAQLMILCVLFIFYKAIQEKRRVRFIYIAIGTLVLTYLSHEETFIILPALLCCVLLISKDSTRLLPSVIYQKHWWFASFIGVGIIAIQLVIVRVSHPPILGTDQSMRPQIQLTIDNIPFYVNMLVLHGGENPLLTLDTVLAIAGCIGALRSRDSRAWYWALFLIISVFALVFLFTMQATRYFYPILTMYYVMGAYGAVHMLQACWHFAHPRLAQQSVRQVGQLQQNGVVALPLRLVAGGIVALVCVTILILPMLPMSDYNLFVSRITGLTYHQHYGDYDVAGEYVRQHEQKGDVIISVTPDIIVYYYAGQSDYFFSLDRALFIFERDGHIINTATGAIALFNQSDLQSVLSSHTRVLLIADSNYYQLDAGKRFYFPPDFHVAYEGYGSVVYVR